MTLEQCNGNWNFLYEFRIGDNWYPCHVVEMDDKTVMIFTRNGTITRERISNVRKMDSTRYLLNRSQYIIDCGKYAYDHGYHEREEEDLRLLQVANELEQCQIFS